MWGLIKVALEIMGHTGSNGKPSLMKIFFKAVKLLLMFTIVIAVISMGLGVWFSENYL